jgi:hypothetical protein
MRKFFSPDVQWKYGWQSLAGTVPFLPILFVLRNWELPVWIFVPTATLSCGLAFFAVQWWIFKNYFLLDFIQPLKEWMLKKKNLLPDEY